MTNAAVLFLYHWPLGATYTAYSDASLKGWGMILIRHSDRAVFSAGGKWSNSDLRRSDDVSQRKLTHLLPTP